MTELMRGVNECIAKIEKLKTRYRQQKALKPAYMAGAEVVRSHIAARAPVRTGALRDSIIAEWDSRKSKAVVGPRKNIRYGFAVEFGTSDTRAQPFMRTGLNAGSVGATQAIAEGMKKIVEDVP